MRSLIFGGVVVMVGLAGFLLMSTTSVSKKGGVEIGKTPTAGAACREGDDCFPEFNTLTIDGKPITDEDLKGKTVLVNHWATWCGPCVQELPALESVYERYRDQGFVVLGLAADGNDILKVQKFVHSHGVTYPVVPMDSSLERSFGRPNLIPQSALYGADGKLKRTWQGALTEGELVDALK